MEQAEERLLALAPPNSQLFLGNRNATVNGQSIPKHCFFLIPWRNHCAAVKITINQVAPPDCNGYVFSFCSSIVSVICHSKISGLRSKIKTTLKTAFKHHLPQVYLKFDNDVFSYVSYELPTDIANPSCLSKAETCLSVDLSRDAEVGRGERSHDRTQNRERNRNTGQEEESETPAPSSTSSASDQPSDPEVETFTDEESQADQSPDPEVRTADGGSQTDKLLRPETKAFAKRFIESICSPPMEYHLAQGERLPQWSQNESKSYQSYATQLANFSRRQKKERNLFANLLEFTAGCIYEAAPRLPTIRVENNDICTEGASTRTSMFRLSKKMAFINQVVDSLKPHWGAQALDIYQLLASRGTLKSFEKLSDVQRKKAAELVVNKLCTKQPVQRPSNPYNLVSVASTLLQLSVEITAQAFFPVDRRIIVPATSVDKRSTKRKFSATNLGADISRNKQQRNVSHLDGSGDLGDDAVQGIQAQFQRQSSTASLPTRPDDRGTTQEQVVDVFFSLDALGINPDRPPDFINMDTLAINPDRLSDFINMDTLANNPDRPSDFISLDTLGINPDQSDFINLNNLGYTI